MDDQGTNRASFWRVSRGFKIFLAVFFGIWGYIALSDIGFEFFMWLRRESGQPPWMVNSATLLFGFVMTLLPFVAIGAGFKRVKTGAVCGIVVFLVMILLQVLAS